jgi:hypothetical protein
MLLIENFLFYGTVIDRSLELLGIESAFGGFLS